MSDMSLRLSDDLCAFGTVSQKSLGVRAAVAVGSDATERYLVSRAQCPSSWTSCIHADYVTS